MVEQSDDRETRDPDDRPAGDEPGRAYRRAGTTGDPSRPTAGDRSGPDRPGSERGRTDPGEEPPGDEGGDGRDESAGGGDEAAEGDDGRAEGRRIQRPRRLYGFEHRTATRRPRDRRRPGEPAERRSER